MVKKYQLQERASGSWISLTRPLSQPAWYSRNYGRRIRNQHVLRMPLLSPQAHHNPFLTSGAS